MSDNTPSLFRYGRAFNTHDGLKILALLFMVIDHIGWYFADDNWICRLLGRGAAPIFFYLVGFSGKVHLSVFLIAYGIILSLTTGLIVQHIWINILLNFVMIHFVMHFYKLEHLSTLTRIIAFVFLTILTPLFYPYFEYAFLGILVAYSARSIALNERFSNYWMAATLIVYAMYQSIIFNFAAKTGALAALGCLFLGLFLVFTHFKITALACPPRLLVPALFISRYSLHLYFYHLILLQAYYIKLYPILITRYFH